GAARLRRTLPLSAGRPEGIEQVTHSRLRRVEQADNQPSVLMPVHVADVEMRVVLFDHRAFIPLPEHRLPAITVLVAPAPVRLTHLPISAHDPVAFASSSGAAELVSEL